MARRDKKENDGMKRQKEKMPRRDKKKRWHEEITRRNMSSLLMGTKKATSLPFRIKMWPIDFYTG